jgi:DNA-directed RNA polymerase II subunit RPB3
MNPSITSIFEEGDILRFTLNNINVSLANGLRRTVLSEIDTVVFRTETYDDNQCTIYENTGRLHNEIVKHRLSCIPIHSTHLETLPNHYVMELDVTNDSETMIVVTSGDFRIKNKESGNYLTEQETRKIFPADPMTQSFIDFIRLRPKLGDSIPGEKIRLTCEFSVANAKVNSMFNVVSKCAYGNTPDKIKAEEMWLEIAQKLVAEGMTKEEIEFQKTNFYLLDAQRQFIPDSFDFVVQTVGVFENKEIVKKACIVLQNKFVDMIEKIESDMIPIITSETTIENSYDIILENEDYTIGKILEYILYEKYYMGEKIASYCGFKKLHPHDLKSIIRFAYNEKTDKHMCRTHLKRACNEAQDVFTRIYKMF